MKHVFSALKTATLLLTVTSSLIFSGSAFAQTNANSGQREIDPIYGDSLDGFNVNLVMDKAQQKGLGPYESALFLNHWKREFINRRYGLAPSASRNTDLASMRIQNGVAMAPCTNMDFETGTFAGWTGFIGDNTLSSNGPLQNITNGFFSNGMNALVSDMLARHTIVSAAAGNDPCGGFPCVCAGGNYSVRLGNTYANYQGQAIEQTFTVGPGNTSFTYNYAVVLYDGGHSSGEQPYFRIEMYDQSGNLIPCAQYYVEASGSVPGFVSCGFGTYYHPWTTVNADLTAYMASTVTIRFTAAGCIYGGHYGYAYIDAGCFPYTISTTDSLCVGSSTVLQAPAGAVAYSWMPTGDTTQNITVSTAGSYTVDMTSVTGCHTQLEINVGMYPPPVAAFTPNYGPCSPTISFANNSTISAGTLTYHWDFGDPAILTDTSNIVSPTYTYTNPGTYTVTLIAYSSNGCSDTITQVVNAGSVSPAAFINTTACLNDPTQFTDQTVGAVGWSWHFGDPGSGPLDSSQLQNPIHYYASTGTYPVTLTATSANGCTSTITINVTVSALPVGNFSSNLACPGFPTIFNDISVAGVGTTTNWTWDFGDGSPTSNVQNPSHTYGNDSTYNVNLIVTNSSGCIDTVNLAVTTLPSPNVLFTADTFAGCPALCVNFIDQSTIATGSINGWTWDFGDNSPLSTVQNPSHCYLFPGTYTVKMTTVSAGGCVSSLVIPNMITVYPVPHASFTATPQTTTILNTNISFVDLSTGNISAWLWNFGDPTTTADSSIIQNPSYVYTTEYGDTYPVNLLVTNQFGCVDDTTIEIIVEPEFTFFIPNAFTPNGDGKNDFFFGTGIGISSYTMWVFDRWGNLLFTTNDINQGWDGTVQGKAGGICQEDVYVWKVALTDWQNKPHKYIGHVSLIK